VSRVSEFTVRALARLTDSFARNRLTQFEALEGSESEVVMLGDSITDGGLWNEWFHTIRVANRGSSGNTSAQLLERMHAAGLTSAARHVCILIGTNDLAQGIRPDRIVSNVSAITRYAQSHAPNATVLLHGVTPRQAKFRGRIEQLNRRYRLVAQSLGAEYIDLHPVLADDDGCLRADLTSDGLHFNGAGYRTWAQYLAPILEAPSLTDRGKANQ
jgi:lysophospholipase L1-like esterase